MQLNVYYSFCSRQRGWPESFTTAVKIIVLFDIFYLSSFSPLNPIINVLSLLTTQFCHVLLGSTL